jgi:hypothetical protein
MARRPAGPARRVANRAAMRRSSLLALLVLGGCLTAVAHAGAAPYGASGGETSPEQVSGATLAPDDPPPQVVAAPRATHQPAAPAATSAPAPRTDAARSVARAAQTPVEPAPGVPGGGNQGEDGQGEAPPRAEPQGDAPGTADSGGGLPMSGANLVTVFVVGVMLFGFGLAGVAIARGRALSKY